MIAIALFDLIVVLAFEYYRAIVDLTAGSYSYNCKTVHYHTRHIQAHNRLLFRYACALVCMVICCKGIYVARAKKILSERVNWFAQSANVSIIAARLD